MSWSERGFTQIELLMVLALVAIVAAMSLPRFDLMIETYKLRSDARQLAWVLRSARQEAITTGYNKFVMFKIYQQQYETGEATYSLSPGISFVGTTTFKEMARIPTCGFRPSGSPTSGGTVTLENKYNKMIQIKVNVSAGRIRIVEVE